MLVFFSDIVVILNLYQGRQRSKVQSKSEVQTSKYICVISGSIVSFLLIKVAFGFGMPALTMTFSFIALVSGIVWFVQSQRRAS